MLDKFEEWLRLNELRLRDRNVRIDLIRPEVSSDKKGAYVDIDTDLLMARVTLWDTGECDTEIIDNKADETILYEHVIVPSPRELPSILDSFFKRLEDSRVKAS
ncbi:MAG: hypothetical protein WKF30_02505 [Pyrinomonadaceae bacterium]